MQASGEIYTLGIWIVKTGKEEEFIREWTSFAQWTEKQMTGSGKGYLLRDTKEPNRFISYGTWSEPQRIQEWRNNEAFGTFVLKAKALCDDFQPHTLSTVATSAG